MAARYEDILVPRAEGLYCPPGDFFVDPVRPVARAVITHGHADHARAGHGAVLATAETIAIMAARYGADRIGATQALAYGENVEVGGAQVRLAPAGHVLGSAQAVIEAKGGRIVVSGDYKRRADPTCAPFEVVPCDVFVTEATFALPVFRHPDTGDEIARLLASVARNPERAHVVGAYSLGKAQRIIAELRAAGWDAPIWRHGALEKINDIYSAHGIALGDIRPALVAEKSEMAGGIVIAPPSAIADKWSRRLPDPVTAFASGWMRVRARARQRGVELPLIISDHADWDELTTTLKEVAADQVWITHGRDDALMRWAELEGVDARPLRLVGYDEEGE